ncbi:MAG: IS110 family transposase, partial [candidate division KSB1 bacterium]|nr:IS110 family transposase [candidate division KSB1 bacterium]
VLESRAGYQHLLAKLEQLARQYQTQEFRIGMEATGDYWKNLYPEACVNFYFISEKTIENYG